jgi:protein-tyrosine phosphatase
MEVLFVCTGNTCRSCMAEVIFNSLSDGSMHAASAGAAAIEGSKASRNAVDLLKDKHVVDFSDRYAVLLTPQAMEKSDLILTMTRSLKNYLTDMYPEFGSKIYTLNEYVGVSGDIMDPYGGDVAVYERTYNFLQDSIVILLDKLKKI